MPTIYSVKIYIYIYIYILCVCCVYTNHSVNKRDFRKNQNIFSKFLTINLALFVIVIFFFFEQFQLNFNLYFTSDKHIYN